MTGGAFGSGVFAGEGESGFGVIEPGALPGRSGMALGAGNGDPRVFVVGIGGGVERRHVAVLAILGESFENAIDVTLRTRNRAVLTRERKCGGGVIKDGAFPLRRGVTGGTILREAVMLGIRGPRRILLMAVYAVLGKSLENVVRMARCAGDGAVFAGEGKRGGRMVECCALPLSGVVADGAILREASVGRIRDFDRILLVAIDATGWSTGIFAIDVTGGADRGAMFAGKGEPGLRVIELRALPSLKGVAR